MQINIELREKNFAAFEKRYGFRPSVDKDEDEKYEMSFSEDGGAVLSIKNVAAGKNLRLNSLYDPAYEARKWAQGRDIPDRKATLIILGFSTGVYLQELIKRFRADTSFFVYEPEEGLFSFVCAFVDITSLIEDARVYLAVTKEQKNRMADILISDLATNRPEITGITTPFYGNNEEYEHICSQIEALSIAQRNYKATRGRTALKSRIYAWKHMKNASFLPELTKRIPEGIPAIIASAGPSLLKNVQMLKQAKGHAFIICTDRAYPVLYENGIEPDALISVDAEKNPDFMKEASERDIPLIASYQLNPDSQKLFEGKIIYFDALRYEGALFGEKVGDCSGPDMGGNVAGAAFVVCKSLGINRIILVGQDLAFLDGKHHADKEEVGMPDYEKENIREIPGIYGEPVKSTIMWIKFRDYFSRQLAMHPEIELIDATEGGALIDGSKVMTLREAIDLYCNSDNGIKDILNGMPKGLSDEEINRSNEVRESWIKELKMIEKNATELEKLSNQLVDICKNGDIHTGEAAKKVMKLDQLKKQIGNMWMNYLLEEYWVEDMYSIPDKVIVVDNNEQGAMLFSRLADYYNKLQEDAGLLIDAFEA